VYDGALDVSFVHKVQNPNLNGLEILVGDAPGDTLVSSPSSVSFGSVLVNDVITNTATLTNPGLPNDPSLIIESVVISPADVFGLVTNPSGTVLAPGDQVDVQLEFGPESLGDYTAILTVDYSADGELKSLDIPVAGSGVSSIPISFGATGLSGESSDNPTSIDIGPDGRVYVAQQDGRIYSYEVTRNGPNDYSVTGTETIDHVKDLPNYNDDGLPNSNIKIRQVTGLLATGTETNPILYVTSSDPRIGAGGSGDDTDLDTNSGIVSRLTWTCAQVPGGAADNAACWRHEQVVRGLPRSEENHSANGMALDESTNTLYVMSGGNTNMGAPSNNFAGTPEYALSAALLSIDLESIGFLDEDGVLYDLPTLAGTSEPFGGQNGANQAVLVDGGPVQIYSPGYRNAYDVVLTELGELYTHDNGPNSGWGNVPVGEGTSACTNDFTTGGATYADGFHHITGPGYYGGHPNPTRAGAPVRFFEKQADGSWAEGVGSPVGASPVPSALENPVECDYQVPLSENGAKFLVNASTNGLDEYTASNLGGQLKGDILVASFNGNVYRVDLDASGEYQSSEPIFSNFGSQPLDVTTQGDDDIFPGTVWAVTYGADSITVFEPDDYDSGINQCTPIDPLADSDLDGYTNEDEAFHGTDPCSGASAPPDADTDLVGDLTDPDDDNDGQIDSVDPFAVDPDNGSTTAVTASCPDDFNDPAASVGTCLRFFSGSFPGTVIDLGFTGLMTNGSDDYLSLFDPDQLVAGGANPLLSIENVPAGDALGAENAQQNGFQFGFAPLNKAFIAHTRLVNGPNPTSGAQSAGLYIGDGTQSNYFKVVAAHDPDSSAVGVNTVLEVADSATSQFAQDSSVGGESTEVDLWIEVEPGSNPGDDWTAETYYAVDGNARVLASIATLPGPWFEESTAAGLVSTSSGSGASDWQVDWQSIEVYRPEGADVNYGARIGITEGAGKGASTYSGGSMTLQNTGDADIAQVSIDLSTSVFPDMVWDPNGTAGDTAAKGLEANSGASETGFVAASSGFSSPHDPAPEPGEPADDDGYDVLDIAFTDFQPGEVFAFSADIDPNSVEGNSGSGDDWAGSVSGLEIAGATVTIEFADGTTLTSRLFGDSAFGAIALVDNTVGSVIQPTVSVAGETPLLWVGAAAPNGAKVAGVDGTTALVDVTGEPGSVVELMAVPSVFSTPTADPGYFADYEDSQEIYLANNADAQAASYSVTLDDSGAGTVAVPIAQGELLYLAAASAPSGSAAKVSDPLYALGD
jgi:hypothetical protein